MISDILTQLADLPPGSILLISYNTREELESARVRISQELKRLTALDEILASSVVVRRTLREKEGRYELRIHLQQRKEVAVILPNGTQVPLAEAMGLSPDSDVDKELQRIKMLMRKEGKSEEEIASFLKGESYGEEEGEREEIT